VHAEAAWGAEACWSRDSDLPFSELVRGFVEITLCHKMGHFLSEPNFQRCPIAACAKERGCDVPEKRGKWGKRHLVEQQKGHGIGGGREGGVAYATFFFSGRQA